MKIRMGFVANSSSSSFIVALDQNKDRMTREEFQKMMFGDAEYVCDPYNDYNWPTQAIATHIFYSLFRIEPIDLEEERDVYKWNNAAISFAVKNKHKYLYTCTLDDDNSFSAAIESGEYFDNFDYFKMSNH